MHNINLNKEILNEKEKRNIEILDILRKRGPTSRPEISKDMGINVVTISNYIDDFIKNNLVFEKELDVSDGGRRPVLLDLNPQAGFAIGVGLNLANMVGLLVDLKGNIITKTQAARPRSSVTDISECILDIIREILRRSKEYTAQIKGIGVGVAGLINKETGSISWPQKMDHYYTYTSVDVPLKSLIEKEFDLPCLMENDATSACFGEHWLGLAQGYKNIIYMFSGVGCGIMINGDIYRGARGYAGELSIYNFKEQDAFCCELGDDCFIKRWETDLGIVKDAQNSYTKENKSINNLDLKSILNLARLDDKIAVAVLERAAKRLGVKIAYLVNLLNPEIIIIGGGLEEAGEDFLKQVNTTVKDWAFREATEDLNIYYSQLRENSVALGAASLVTQKVFAQL